MASDDLPEVRSEYALSNSFLGKIMEIGLVTEYHQRTMEGLVRLGIVPSRVYTFAENSISNQRYKGEASPFGLKVCFATSELSPLCA